jgi:hypothetical protein
MVRTRTVELGGTELGVLRTCARAARARPRVRAPLRLSPSSYLSSDLFLKIVSVSGTGTRIKAVLSDHEGIGQPAYRNPACIVPGCTGESH